MDSECEPSTSVSTIRGLTRLNTLTLTMSDASFVDADGQGSQFPSRPSSPHSALPSPSSPSGDSVSSLPSVSSSFLFSSGPGSPPHPSHLLPGSRSDVGFDGDLHDSTRGLIIPSLALPSPARRPTPYGQTLGDLRLLILAPRRAASSTAALVASLLDENEDIVDVASWEEELHGSGDGADGGERASVLRASTDWVEHRDPHGLERIEPARNVEIVELPGYDPSDDAQTIADRTLPIVHAPFYQVLDVLNSEHAPSAVLANLLSSSATPLYTAMILLLTSSPTPTERALLDALSPHVPLIVIPPLPAQPPYSLHTSGYSSYPSSAYSSAYNSPNYPAGSSSLLSNAPLSAFRPSSPEVLRLGLFRTPETLAHLRSESAARFLRWREVERAVERIHASCSGNHVRSPTSKPSLAQKPGTRDEAASGWKGKSSWSKAQWEAEWEGTLSQDIAVGLQRRKRADTAIAFPRPQPEPEQLGEKRPAAFTEGQVSRVRRPSQTCASAPFDPLHVQSLFMFSLSLLGPLRARVVHSLSFGMMGSAVDERDDRAECAGGEREAGSKTTGGARFGFGLGLALVGAFCAGIGLGLLAARR